LTTIHRRGEIVWASIESIVAAIVPSSSLTGLITT
jgi:hypothetical protein